MSTIVRAPITPRGESFHDYDERKSGVKKPHHGLRRAATNLLVIIIHDAVVIMALCSVITDKVVPESHSLIAQIKLAEIDGTLALANMRHYFQKQTMGHHAAADSALIELSTDGCLVYVSIPDGRIAGACCGDEAPMKLPFRPWRLFHPLKESIEAARSRLTERHTSS